MHLMPLSMFQMVQEKGIEFIGFECFDPVRFQGSIGVSRVGPNTSYLYAKEAQSNLI